MTEKSTELEQEPRQSSLTEIELEKPSVEPGSVRIQLSFGLVVVGTLLLLLLGGNGGFFPTATDLSIIGSSLDQSHQPVNLSTHSRFLGNLISTGVPLLSHYPWLLANHLGSFNLFLVFSISFALSLTQLDLVDRFGARTGAAPAIWTFVLFSVFALTTHDIFSISSTASLLSLTLVVVAIFCDLRYLLLGEGWYSSLASGALVLAFIAQPIGLFIAVPLIIFNHFLFGRGEWAMAGTPSFLKGCTSYLAIGLLGVLLFPSFLGVSSLSTLEPSGFLQPFSDLLKIDESVARILRTFITIGLSGCFAIGLIRFTLGLSWLAPISVPLLWLFSTLVFGAGSTMLQIEETVYLEQFLVLSCAASVALLLPLLAMPSVDTLSRRFAIISTLIGSVFLSCVLIPFGYHSVIHSSQARRQVNELNQVGRALSELLRETEVPKPVSVIADPLIFPSDYSSEPLDASRIGTGVFGLLAVSDARERRSTGSAEHSYSVSSRGGMAFVGKESFSNQTENEQFIFRYSRDSKRFERVKHKGSSHLYLRFGTDCPMPLMTEPKDLKHLPPDRWSKLSAAGFISIEHDGMSVSSRKHEDSIVWLALAGHLNPASIGGFVLTTGDSMIGDALGNMSLVFRSAAGEQESILFKSAAAGQLEVITADNSRWLESDSIAQLGLRFAADSSSPVLKSIESRSMSKRGDTEALRSSDP